MDYEIRDAWMSFSRQRRLGNSVNISKVWFPHVSSGNTNPCQGHSVSFTYAIYSTCLTGEPSGEQLSLFFLFG